MTATKVEMMGEKPSAPTMRHRVRVTRVALTAGIASAIIFALCWVGTFIPFSSPTHAYIALFTRAEATSAQALAEGRFWSLLFGLLSGAVIAGVYNSLAALER